MVRASLVILLSHVACAYKQTLLGRLAQDDNIKPASSTMATPVVHRNANATDAFALAHASESHARRTLAAPPCQCMANNPAWTPTARTVPKCIFIDLGAADGNTFRQFLNNDYGPIANCPSGGQWEAYLVEANPHFDAPLQALATQYPGQVHVFPSTAAFSCVAQTSFYIDADPTHNHWGSSMSDAAPDAVKSGKQKVTVPTANVIQLLGQNTIPQDWVIYKVDIEGAEYEVVPCLANFAHANLIDRMFLEEHTWFETGSQNGPAEMEAAKQRLRAVGVDIPQYFTQTL